MAADRVTDFARSGWPPAAAVLGLVTWLQVASGTRLADLVAFAVYAALCLVVPGTLLWRFLRPPVSRLWLEDVVLGTILGYAVEIAVYAAARWVGQPLLVLAWPVVVYSIAVATRRGRRAWRPTSTVRLPGWWSWSVSGVLTYLIVFVARANWWETGLTGERLRVIGPDASFQLALTGELRHHVPPSIPWVAGEPLHYHWFTYVHTAAATWVTGVEPIVMLRRLAPLLMALLVVLAVAVIAHRVSRRPAMGPLAAGLLVLVHSPAFYAAESDHFQRQEFTSSAIFGSPTMTFGMVFFCGVLFLVLEILGDRTYRWSWPMLAVLMAAASGAKATFSPMLVAGSLTVLAIGALRRSTARSHAGLFALTVTVWLVFQFGFYAGESTGVRLTASGTLEWAASSFGASTPDAWSAAGVTVAAVVVLLWAAHMAGMLGLVARGGWRDPGSTFLLGFTASGLGASLLLDLGAASQQWFVASTQAAVAVGAALGFGRIVRPGGTRSALPVVVPVALIGIFGMAAGWATTPTIVPAPGVPLGRLWEYSAAFVVTLLILFGGALVLRVVGLSRPGVQAPLLFLCVGLTALGSFRTVQVSVALAQVPWATPTMSSAADVTVGRGGVDASRWLRAHSSPDDLLATNGHALTPSSDLQLAFWLAGYAERRVLVESWGYTPRHARIMASTGLGFDEVPFWDRELLELNDGAFANPTPALLRQLEREYDVSWLVLDRRFPSDPAALSTVLNPVHTQGDYVIYRLDDLS